MTSYDDALKAIAAQEGWEYIDCRVNPEAAVPRRKRATALEAGARRSAAAPVPTLLVAEPREPDWQDEPRHVEAAARGRKVHEDALVLMEEKGIEYQEAIEVVLGRRNDA